MNITVIGTIFTDIKGHPFEKFMPEGRNAGYIEYVHGGVARNIAEDLAYLGDKPLFVSLCEPGGFGDEVLSRLDDAGVDIRFIQRKARGSGTWLAVFDENGNVFSSVSARADLDPLADILDAHHEEIFGSADLIILEIDIDEKAVRKTFEYAEKYNIKVCCAVATMSHALDKTEYLKKAEVFLCNQQEAGMLLKRDLGAHTPEKLLEVIRKELAGTGLGKLVVTLSENGSVYADCSGSFGICPAIPAETVDSTGAGDSYCAGFCASYCREADLEKACEAGTKIASFVVASENNVYTGSAIYQKGKYEYQNQRS